MCKKQPCIIFYRLFAQPCIILHRLPVLILRRLPCVIFYRLVRNLYLFYAGSSASCIYFLQVTLHYFLQVNEKPVSILRRLLCIIFYRLIFLNAVVGKTLLECGKLRGESCGVSFPYFNKHSYFFFN